MSPESFFDGITRIPMSRLLGHRPVIVEPPRADCNGIAYEIPEDQSEIPGISVFDAPSTDAMSMGVWGGAGGLSTSGPRLAPLVCHPTGLLTSFEPQGHSLA